MNLIIKLIACLHRILHIASSICVVFLSTAASHNAIRQTTQIEEAIWRVRSSQAISLMTRFIARWSYDKVQINDISVEDYITATASKHPVYMPHTAGRYQAKRFRKAQCPIVEMLTNSLMMHGRNNGKKLMAVRIIKHTTEIIRLLTDQNPIQVIVDAVINSYAIKKKDEIERVAKAIYESMLV
ncbi:hypothetical protein F511_01201 [Dorcoceras hygrometricum]|uniref:Small ribosomal subunit protein uS7 domain-containing protein n=1 Tax=Dorcoceras hygrometricum TaxID=472368 RepID=A0A2Z7BRW8_9LAMI|nr:hypothetical protein F511_01201 [Dorcoceras hygrometricum]